MALYYIREGQNRYGNIIATYDSDTGNVRAGSNRWTGEIIFRVEGNKIRASNGGLGIGTIMMTIDGNYIRSSEGVFGKIIASISKEGDYTYIRDGQGAWSKIIANISKTI